MAWEYEFQRELLKAKTFSSAVRLFSKRPKALELVASPRKVSYSQISKKMGLRSRSNVREVAEGLKNPSPAFLFSFCEAWKMTAAWKSFFYALHALEITDSIRERETLNQARQRIRKQLARKAFRGESKNLLHSPSIPLVFAALGSVEQGSPLLEISKKTGLPAEKIDQILAELVAAGAAKVENGIAYPIGLHLVLETVGADEFFRRDTSHSLTIAKNRLNLPNTNDYFFGSTFSIQEQDLPTLKDKLDILLKDYVSEAESSEGNRIVNLTAFLIPAQA